MLADIKASGRRNYSIFLGEEGRLFGYYETEDDEAARAYLATSTVAARWDPCRRLGEYRRHDQRDRLRRGDDNRTDAVAWLVRQIMLRRGGSWRVDDDGFLEHQWLISPVVGREGGKIDLAGAGCEVTESVPVRPGMIAIPATNTPTTRAAPTSTRAAIWEPA